MQHRTEIWNFSFIFSLYQTVWTEKICRIARQIRDACSNYDYYEQFYVYWSFFIKPWFLQFYRIRLLAKEKWIIFCQNFSKTATLKKFQQVNYFFFLFREEWQNRRRQLDSAGSLHSLLLPDAVPLLLSSQWIWLKTECKHRLDLECKFNNKNCANSIFIKLTDWSGA